MYIFDIETDGLIEQATKIHVLSVRDVVTREIVFSTSNYNKMREWLTSPVVKIGHNIIRYDNVVVKKILGVDVAKPYIDTLPLSWTLNHEYIKHGLEQYGEMYEVPKPKIDDWENLTYDDYENRCETDTEINLRLWVDLNIKLKKLYPDEDERQRYINYLNFKMECAAKQEELGWKLDIPKAQALFEELSAKKEEKEKALAEAMPRKIITKVVNKPKVMYKKDGTLSSNGEKWEQLCRDNYQPTSVENFVVKVGEELGNPNSNDQVKDWLFSLGWEPRTFKFTRNKKTGVEKQIEQVRRDGELCPSVIDLIEDNPAVALLDGLTVLTHRLGIVKGFLESVDADGYLKAEVAGLTNTLRFKHSKPLVNLPAVDKPYGKEIRSLLTVPDGWMLLGSDMVSLEDTTKRHYIQPLDPEYVAEMSEKGYDPHLSLAVFSGKITQSDYRKYQTLDAMEKITSYEDQKWYKQVKAIRKAYKVVNYSATYGVGAAKLARETGLSVGEAQGLLTAFWKKNWAVRQVAEGLHVRELFGGMWVLNPVSGFWYSLRSEKDRFSTLNQSTGVYCFDRWVAEGVKRGYHPIGQFHDEVILAVKKDYDTGRIAEEVLRENISCVNDQLVMNFPLDIDVQFGITYADIH